jgi:hypothetical protein
VDIGAEGQIPFFRRDVLDLLEGRLMRGVVDEDVDATGSWRKARMCPVISSPLRATR